MVSIVKIINGQKKLIPFTSDVGSGVPLGTLVAFSDDTPKDGYVQMGTTFDETKYPMLFAMRGSNVLPAMFDHTRLGDWETAIISADSNNPTVMQYDGYLTVKDTYTANNGYSSIFVNGVSVNQVNMAGATGDAIYNADGTIIPFKKGQSIYILTYNARGTERHIAYYTHPLYIKATSGLSENQQENVLNTLNNNLSYSTEEHATGRRWIDGKMIYEKTVYKGTALDGSNVEVASVFNNDCDTLIKATYTGLRENSTPMTCSFNTWLGSNGTSIYANADNKIWDVTITLEYTKTT